MGQNYGEEEDYLRTWIGDRLAWMEGQWGGLCYPLSARSEQSIPKPGIMKAYPNPSDLSQAYVTLNFSLPMELQVRLYDMSGRIVFRSDVEYSGSAFAYPLPDLSFLPDGIYTLEVTDGMQIREMCKLIKQ